jgi:ferredoxin
MVAASHDQLFFASECVSCGACVQACPSHAPVEKSLFEGTVIMPCRTRSIPTVRHHDMPISRHGLWHQGRDRNGRITRIIPWKEGRQNTIIAASKASSPLSITIILIACARLSYVLRVRATLHWLSIVEAGSATSRLSRLATCYPRADRSAAPRVATANRGYSRCGSWFL